jgi:hypothetical protein
MIKKITAIWIVCLSIGSVMAGTIDPNINDQKYIEYGSKFKNIVRLCCKDGDGMFGCGSGVVISKHWVITAAHIVYKGSDCSIKIDDRKYDIDKVIIHNGYRDSVFGKDDVALCYIKEEIVMDFYPEIYGDSDESGKLCSMAGWGFTGTFNSGAMKHDGKRRAGSNIIDRFERSVLICSPSRRGAGHTELEFLIASGDSGGGLFIGNKLAGIHSSVLAIDKKPDSTYSDESCHTRLSLYKEWIDQTTKD